MGKKTTGMTSLTCLPYACGLGASSLGAEQGPAAFYAEARKLGLPQLAWHPDFELRVEHRAAPALGSSARQQHVTDACRRLADNVAQTVRSGSVPISIGGDHSMAIGSISGFAEGTGAYGKIGLLWIDAHLDSNTPQSSPSNAIHGMPIATLLGKGIAELNAIGGDRPKLLGKHIAVIGARSMDPEEKGFLIGHGATVINDDEVRRIGLPAAFARALPAIMNGTTHRYLSFDLDVLDPKEAPAVTLPEENGLRYADLLPCLKDALATAHFDGFDIAEYCPPSDEGGKTGRLMLELLSLMHDACADNTIRIAG